LLIELFDLFSTPTTAGLGVSRLYVLFKEWQPYKFFPAFIFEIFLEKLLIGLLFLGGLVELLDFYYSSLLSRLDLALEFFLSNGIILSGV